MIDGLRKGGTFLLNTVTPAEEVENLLPAKVKKQLAEKEAKLYIINAVKLSEEAGLPGRTNTIMQSAFFALNEQIMPYKTAQKLMKKYVEKEYSRKGQDVVEKNWKAIDMGAIGLIEIEVKDSWKNLTFEAPKVDTSRPVYVRDIADQVNAIKGYAPYFEEVFGDSEVTIDRIAQAIASFERTVVSGNSALICRVASIPFNSGMLISITILTPTI